MDEVKALNYPPPVSALLIIGDVRRQQEAIDYREQFGLGEEDIPDLIRMMLDEELWWADTDGQEVWANIHAWRALGQLRATAAIPALIEVIGMKDEVDSDWITDEIPEVLAQIGPDALPALQEFLDDPKRGIYARTTASSAIQKIGEAHPEFRLVCVKMLTEQLRKFHQQTQILNAFLILALVDLKAVESAAVMEAAFAADRVDLSINGDWEEVQIELGLLQERITPPPPGGWLQLGDYREDIEGVMARLEMRVAKAQQGIEDAKRKKARKQAKATRKKQRIQKKRKRK